MNSNPINTLKDKYVEVLIAESNSNQNIYFTYVTIFYFIIMPNLHRSNLQLSENNT